MNGKTKSIAVKGLYFVSIVLASVYLTLLVDIYTLNTVLKRVFVFCYFVVMCTLFVYLRNRFAKARPLKDMILISTVIAGSILAVFQSTFLPAICNQTISLRAHGDGEVWLTDVAADGESIPLSQLAVEHNSGWTYNSEYDDYVFYPNTENIDNYLTLSFVAEDVSLNFAVNDWSGSVSLINMDGKAVNLELFAETQDADNVYQYFIHDTRNYSAFDRFLYNFGAFTILVFFINLILVILVGNKGDDSLIKITSRDKIFMAVTALLAVVTAAVFVPQLFYEGEEFSLAITSLNDRNPNCEGYEMGFRLTSQGRTVLPESCDSGWMERGGGYLCVTPDQTITFKLNSLNKNEIAFFHHRYAAKIRMDFLENSEVIDLFSVSEQINERLFDRVYSLKPPLVIMGNSILLMADFLCFALVLIRIFRSVQGGSILTFFVIFIIQFNLSKELQYQYNIIFALSILSFLYLIRRKYIYEIHKE